MTVADAMTWLFVPGDRPDRFDKAVASEAAGVILDLEDSVLAEHKRSAREHVARFLNSSPALVAVRVNVPHSTACHDDLVELAALGIPLIVFVPKVETAAAIATCEAALEPGTRLVAMIESARGVRALDEILNARSAALMIGAADLSADLGAEISSDVVRAAAAAVLVAAAAFGTPVIASPTFEIDNDDAVSLVAEAAVANGYAGMAAIHPRQLAPIQAAFQPSDSEIATATRLLAIDGVGTMDGTMVDEAVLRSARRVLARAHRN